MCSTIFTVSQIWPLTNISIMVWQHEDVQCIVWWKRCIKLRNVAVLFSLQWQTSLSLWLVSRVAKVSVTAKVSKYKWRVQRCICFVFWFQISLILGIFYPSSSKPFSIRQHTTRWRTLTYFILYWMHNNTNTLYSECKTTDLDEF